jgi:hypothetical protein
MFIGLPGSIPFPRPGASLFSCICLHMLIPVCSCCCVTFEFTWLISYFITAMLNVGLILNIFHSELMHTIMTTTECSTGNLDPHILLIHY